MLRSRVKCNRERGANAVELAIVSAALVVMVWMVLSLYFRNHILAKVLVAENLVQANPQPRPLTATVFDPTTTGAAQVSALSDIEVDAYVANLQTSYLTQLEDAGFPASAAQFSIRAKLYYVHIDPVTGRVTNGPSGNFFEEAISTGATTITHTPAGTNCILSQFGGGGEATFDAQLSTYATNKLAILNPASYPKVIGTRVIFGDSSSGTPYLPFRGVAAVGITACSAWMPFFAGVTRFTFIYPNKEVGLG